MALHLLATVLASEETTGHSGEAMTVSPWWFGAAAMAGFLLLLFVVTRLNLDR
jgi:hypothetical protein